MAKKKPKKSAAPKKGTAKPRLRDLSSRKGDLMGGGQMGQWGTISPKKPS